MGETATIEKLDIAETGYYPQSSLSEQDFDDMVKNFELWRERGSNVPPKVKLGHSASQEFLSRSGYPSAGNITKIWREGKKLFASIADVPRVVADLINKRAYSSRSIEAHRNTPPIGMRLTGLALLGDQVPAIETLEDFAALYQSKNVPVTYGVELKGDGSMDGQDQDKNKTDDKGQKQTDDKNTATDAEMKKRLDELEVENKRLNEEREKNAETIKSMGETLEKLKSVVGVGVESTDGDDGKGDADSGDGVQKIAAQAQKDAHVIHMEANRIRTEGFRSICNRLVKAGKLPPAVVDAGLIEFAMQLNESEVVKFEKEPESMSDRLVRLLEALPVKYEVGKEMSSGDLDDAKDPEAEKKERALKFEKEYEDKQGILGDTSKAEYVAARESVFHSGSEKK